MAMQRWVLPLLAVLAAAADPAGREAGSIHGRVVVPEQRAPGPRPATGDLAATRHDPVHRRRAVVYLDTAPRQAFDELRAGRARMDQRGEQFEPRVLAITAGTVVDFPNNDAKFHNVFSLSPIKTFDLGRYPAGRSKAVLFDKPGIVPVFCDVHSHMSAYILVFSHPFFAVSDDQGRYEIPNVPAGSYTLKVWSEIGTTQPRRVAVADGAATETDFRVGRQAP